MPDSQDSDNGKKNVFWQDERKRKVVVVARWASKGKDRKEGQQEKRDGMMDFYTRVLVTHERAKSMLLLLFSKEEKRTVSYASFWEGEGRGYPPPPRERGSPGRG